eukprot:SAG31_NODE_6875_length_1863_cov_1.834467_2_plen_184_part_00
MHLMDNPNDLMLAGDTCQTIARGVGFRFDEIRSMFFEMRDKKQLVGEELTSVPDLTLLSINYRTHNGILAAAAEVVTMLTKLFPGSIDKMAKDRGYFPGSPPFMVENQNDLLQLLMGTFPDCWLLIGFIALWLNWLLTPFQNVTHPGDNEEKSQIEFGAHQVNLLYSFLVVCVLLNVSLFIEA